MDVYLIPTATSEQYELYYEAPDEEIVDLEGGSGFLHRMKVKFSEALKEAEEWRHRRNEESAQSQGVVARLRRKTMSFIVERIAEQRLLWHTRNS